MFKYWPNKQSLKLNNAVIELFYKTKIKIKNNLSNKTKFYLYTDMMNHLHKQQLFLIILKELEKLILDIIELNITPKNIKQLKYRILYDFVYTVSKQFTITFQTKYRNYLIGKLNFNHSRHLKLKSEYIKIIELEDYMHIENLLIYLTFGCSYIGNKTFLFNKLYTPQKHVQILFENFIIQVGNCVIHNLTKNFSCLSDMIYFLKLNTICNSSYLSTRSIALFFNNLNWQNYIYIYLYQPKLIYSAYYQVLIFTLKGIENKYIYTSRLSDLKKLSNIQMFFLFVLELKDLCIPKIEKFLITVIKYITYTFINLFSNFFILIIKAILFSVQKL
uniref:Uncharacterized protein n=1 Tax=Caloglossa monosticha TaxID=76906 RepID=A0A1Z1M4J0_9FLOR|nr:hypothetical protein [Caloglossa monosticha]ARW60959.1 hypothetical protein [Caloglossa monosticha]